MVKADAYGLGLEPVARALLEEGCASFFVAHLSEGQALRAIAPDARIFILNGLPPDSSPLFAASGLIPVLGSLPEIAEWAGFCRAQGARHPAAIHIDTGMNRLGLPAADLFSARALIAEDFEPVLAMSHFISAEDSSSPRNQNADRAFRAGPRRIAAHAGFFVQFLRHVSPTRRPFSTSAGRAMRFTAAIPPRAAKIPCGAWSSFTPQSCRSAMSRPAKPPAITPAGPRPPAGVSPRSISATPTVFRAAAPRRRPACRSSPAARFCPVVGRISMDLSIIDISDAGPLQRGDRVEILGPHISVDELAKRSGTIGYEILTRLGPRFRREYMRGGKNM